MEWKDRLRECAEELQGVLLDLRARDSELETAKDEASGLSSRMGNMNEAAKRARSEAAEWKALAERYSMKTIFSVSHDVSRCLTMSHDVSRCRAVKSEKKRGTAALESLAGPCCFFLWTPLVVWWMTRWLTNKLCSVAFDATLTLSRVGS